MSQRKYQKRCRTFLNNLDSELQIQIDTQKDKNNEIILAIYSLYSKFLAGSVSIELLNCDKPKSHKKEYLNDFKKKLKDLNGKYLVFRYPLSELEKDGIIVHFSFDNKSKFFDIEKDVFVQIESFSDYFQFKYIYSVNRSGYGVPTEVFSA